MSILIDRNTRVMTQGITGKTGAFHTRLCRDYANGKSCFVAGENPSKAGEDFEGIPIFGSVKDAKLETGATVSVIYVPPPYAAAAIDEAVDAGLDLVGHPDNCWAGAGLGYRPQGRGPGREVGKRPRLVADGFGYPVDPQPHLGDDAEDSLRADQELAQVWARRRRRHPAQIHGAHRGDHAEPEDHVVEPAVAG